MTDELVDGLLEIRHHREFDTFREPYWRMSPVDYDEIRHDPRWARYGVPPSRDVFGVPVKVDPYLPRRSWRYVCSATGRTLFEGMRVDNDSLAFGPNLDLEVRRLQIDEFLGADLAGSLGLNLTSLNEQLWDTAGAMKLSLRASLYEEKLPPDVVEKTIVVQPRTITTRWLDGPWQRRKHRLIGRFPWLRRLIGEPRYNQYTVKPDPERITVAFEIKQWLTYPDSSVGQSSHLGKGIRRYDWSEKAQWWRDGQARP